MSAKGTVFSSLVLCFFFFFFFLLLHGLINFAVQNPIYYLSFWCSCRPKIERNCSRVEAFSLELSTFVDRHEKALFFFFVFVLADSSEIHIGMLLDPF